MTDPKQLYLDVKIDKNKTLASFIECKSTELIISALKEFCMEDSLNQNFFLWGSSGSGKNYLLHSIHQDFTLRKKRVAFISFKNISFSSPEILESLDSLDLIILEGIDLYPKERDWELALFNLINDSKLSGTKILCSSDRVAKELRFTLPDLISRILSFTAFEIKEIKEEEKRQALKAEIARKGLIAEEKVITYILNHTSRGLSDLLQLISDLDGFSLERKRRITIPLIKEMISFDQTV
tara:strand:+ start:4359 stop:5075 length:717 start_codon:yes stop_codon:yes gene_type:complete